MTVWFFLTTAIVLLLIAAHPFITYPASLWVLKKLGIGAPDKNFIPAPKPTFTICLCAYNEAPIIRHKIDDLLKLRAATGDLQILIYVDGASDGTADIVRSYGDQIEAFISEERHGKPWGMNRLMNMARGSIVAFTDATVDIAPDALLKAEEHFRDPEVGVVCSHLIYVNPGETPTAAVGSLYWRLEESIKQLESDTGSVMGADGSLFVIRRALHVNSPPDVLDDIYVSMSILCQGHRIVRGHDVRCYEPSVPDSGEEFYRKIRIGSQAFSGHRLMAPLIRELSLLNRYKYFSHKLLRWMTMLPLVASGVFFFAFLVAWLELFPALAITAAAAIGWLGAGYIKVKPVLLVNDIVGSFLGTFIGVCRSFRGERFATWAPANSIRKARGSE